ncbi:MAG: terminase family protein [Candidatus Acidiferrum sp.]
MANVRLIFIGEVTQVAGFAAIVAGVVLSLHHWPAAVALIGGGAPHSTWERSFARSSAKTRIEPGMSGSKTDRKGPLHISDCYRPFARQKEFHESLAKYRLFGGAAGPGKTKALLWEAIRQALEVDGCDTLLLRRTYPELESSLLSYFRRDVPRSMYKSYNESKHVVTWNNGSTTRFGYCRNERDVYQYQGAEFLFIGLDELTHFTLKQWQFLTSRNRCPARLYSNGKNAGKRIVPCMAGATNPGNIGHAWVKALWVDHVPPPGFERADLYDARDYEFIRARLDDNPIYVNDTEYRRTLEALPEHLRRAFLDGDWNVFAGQYFDVFDYGRHTARPEEIRLEPWWPRWISIDWGFHHPNAVYWHCAVPQSVNRDSWFVAPGRENAPGVSHESPVTNHHLPRIRAERPLAAHAGAGHRRAWWPRADRRSVPFAGCLCAPHFGSVHRGAARRSAGRERLAAPVACR